MRRLYIKLWLIIIALALGAHVLEPLTLLIWVFIGPLFFIGIYDYLQPRRAVLRNFPIIGRARYFFEMIRPEIHQYFVESDRDGVPFHREARSLVYQRSKKAVDTIPFGTKLDIYREGYEWINHSLAPVHVDTHSLTITIGGKDCKQPYQSSLLNISAMSYGSLSKRAITALNQGALKGGFAHNTGEGGISPYHLQGGDLIWQIGTGYFGCRSQQGTFDPTKFSQNARRPEVKMIEIKLSQGAKPGHGGILPASKVTEEISKIRGVPLGKDVLSPPGHSSFDSPLGLMTFIAQLRELSGGKPIGIKLCIGKRREFISICKAMKDSGIYPDYIAIDGGEGGTGAAPLEFSNHIGSPLKEALIFAHNALVGFGLRKEVRVIASGRITSAFDMISFLAVGADLCYAARAFMLSLGCIQALKCNTNECPVGIATQNPELTGGLVVAPKADRVATYHDSTLHSLAEMMGAMGVKDHQNLRPWHLMHRLNRQNIMHYGELYEYLKEGVLLQEDLPKAWEKAVLAARPDSWASAFDLPKKTEGLRENNIKKH